MYFNETVFMKKSFSKDNMFVYISGPRDIYQFTFDILNIDYYKGTSVGFTSLQIQINYINSG